MKFNHLHVITPIKAKQINELEPGDVIIWNAARSSVLRLFPTPAGNLYTVVLQDMNTGRWSTQRLAAERLVGLA